MNSMEWNCSEWRALAPSDTLNRTGKHHAKLIHVSGFLNYLDPTIQDLVGPASLIIFQRNLVVQRAYDAMEYWQGMGKPVVVDLDDAYPILPWSNPAHAFWIENATNQPVNPILVLEEGLRRSDGLVSPNRLILQDWKHVTPGYHLPNFARSEWWSKVITREEAKKSRGIPNERIVIGWGGSVSHYDSWWGSGIKEAATNVSRRHPEVLWMVCGNDKRIFDQLPVSWGSKVWQTGVPPEQWPNIVATFDIGVAPLFGPYDQRRSWIKGLEYMLASVPWIGTTGEPYSDLANFGHVVENGVDSWEAALEQDIASLKNLQAQAVEYKKMGQSLFIENQIPTYEKIYGQIIDNTSAHKGRLPNVHYVNALSTDVRETKPKGESGG